MAQPMEYESTQGEPMEIQESATSFSSGNQQINTTAIITQPGRTKTPNPEKSPPGQYQNQEMSSSTFENLSAGADGQQLDHFNMAAYKGLDLYRSADSADVSAPSDTFQTSSSVSKSSETTSKKRETNLLRGFSVSQEQNTADDDLNPSAPQDVGMVYMTVDWPGEIPQKWKYHLQTALQTWCSQQHFNEQKCTVNEVQLLGDGRTAEVEITPSTALDHIKTASVTFKNLETKTAKVHFQKEKPEFVNEDSSLKENMTVVERIQPEYMKEAEAASNVPGHTDMSGASNVSTVPPFLYWYLCQAYKEELKQIENEFGVQINAETSVSISAKKANEMSRSDVSRATQAFSNLVQKTSNNYKYFCVPQSHMESDIMKEVLCNIPNKEHKIMLSMSANNNLLFLPEQLASVVEKRLNLGHCVATATSFGHSKSPNMETEIRDTSVSWKTMQTLEMDIKDNQAQIEMDIAHWNVISIAFQPQLFKIENKFGIQFDTEITNDLVKVSAKSRGNRQVNLKAHALRALTHLYQKVVTSAVMCELKDASYTEKVSQELERIHFQHAYVGVRERNGSRTLFGLPKHLIPVIADIEKIVGHKILDEKTVQSLGYPFDFPQASGFQRGQMGMEKIKGAHGTNWKDKAKEEPLDVKEDAKKKGSDKSEEDKCPICLDTFTKKSNLKCGHEFCKDCLEQSINVGGKICPICKEIFGTLEGNQPDGTMNYHHRSCSLPGFKGFGTIEITYTIPGGTQTV